LSPVSTTLANFATSFASVVDTGGKVATGVNDAGGKFGAPPVSLTPAVHFGLRISPRIFEKKLNGPNGILYGWGETDS
jgi:hypothetical protein